jgi:hypothetical protein
MKAMAAGPEVHSVGAFAVSLLLLMRQGLAKAPRTGAAEFLAVMLPPKQRQLCDKIHPSIVPWGDHPLSESFLGTEKDALHRGAISLALREILEVTGYPRRPYKLVKGGNGRADITLSR